MCRLSLVMLMTVALSGAALAQVPDQTLPEPLPPPGLDDPAEPGALLPEPLAPPDPAADTTLVDDSGIAAEATDGEGLPPKVLAPDEPAPAVTIRTDAETGDVIEEYRQNGVVYMVRVRPERGPEYTLLDTNGDGRLDESDGGDVRPVYWTLYEWE